jgi:hypothetical protein
MVNVAEESSGDTGILPVRESQAWARCPCHGVRSRAYTAVKKFFAKAARSFASLRMTIAVGRGESVAIEGAGTATAGEPAAVTSLAALLTRHVLREGELVILILKPSLWFIPLSALRFSAVVVVLVVAWLVFAERLAKVHPRVVLELGTIAVAARLMWSTVQWSSRLYVLTDMRIIRLAGVFNVSIFDCPLRKVARTRLVSPVREKAVMVGTIEIIPTDETLPVAQWQTIAKAPRVHEVVVTTINRAKQGCQIQ